MARIRTENLPPAAQPGSAPPHEGGVQITPAEVTKLRRRLHDVVEDNIDRAHEVLAGKQSWSPSQVALFRTILGKTVPDLSERHVSGSIETRQIKELSYEELMRIAAGGTPAEVAPPKTTNLPAPAHDPEPRLNPIRGEDETMASFEERQIEEQAQYEAWLLRQAERTGTRPDINKMGPPSDVIDADFEESP